MLLKIFLYNNFLSSLKSYYNKLRVKMNYYFYIYHLLCNFVLSLISQLGRMLLLTRMEESIPDENFLLYVILLKYILSFGMKYVVIPN